MLTLKAPITIEADNIWNIFFFFFFLKIRLDISYESSAGQMIHMKYHTSFSLKNKIKKTKTKKNSVFCYNFNLCFKGNAWFKAYSQFNPIHGSVYESVGINIKTELYKFYVFPELQYWSDAYFWVLQWLKYYKWVTIASILTLTLSIVQPNWPVALTFTFNSH